MMKYLLAIISFSGFLAFGGATSVMFDTASPPTDGQLLEYNATTGLMEPVTGGVNAALIGTGSVSSTEFGYLDGVTSAIQTQLNAKQATVDFSAIAITGGTITGITDLAIADGGTGAGTADAARTALGLAIGTNVQAYSANLDTFAGIAPAANVVTFLGAADNAAMADIIGAALSEGDLADSIVLSDDIKDGEIVNADINSSAAIASTKLAVPCMRSITQAIAVADFTDNENTTGYVDLSTDIPAESFVIGWKFVGTGAFAGDTTATMQLGKSGTLDAYSAATDGSVFTAATIGSECKSGGSFVLTATTPRVTVTGGADFTSIVTDGNGAGTITIYYALTK